MALLEVENLGKHFPVTRGIIMRHQIGTVGMSDINFTQRSPELIVT